MKRLLLLGASVAFAACAGTPSSGSADKSAAPAFTSADSAAIVALDKRLGEAGRAANWDAWAAEFTDDPVRMPPNRQSVIGKAAADSFNRITPKFTTFDVVTTFVVGRGDLGAATGTYKVIAPAGTASDGKPTPGLNEDGKWMQLLRKQPDGSWKIARDIWNSNLPAPGGTAP